MIEHAVDFSSYRESTAKTNTWHSQYYCIVHLFFKVHVSLTDTAKDFYCIPTIP